MNDRDLSQYEVVREDFFSDFNGIQLNFNKGRMYINNYCLSKFPDEDYVRILINQETKSLVIKPYKEKVRASYSWCGGKNKRKARRVKCLPLFYMIYKMMQWDINARYRITGEIEESSDERIIYFDLEEAVCFICEPGTKHRLNTHNIDGDIGKDIYTDSISTKTIGKTRYRMQMPSEWEKHYGMPIMDFDNRQDIKTFGNMAVFDVEFELNKEAIKITQETKGKEEKEAEGESAYEE